MSSSHPHSVASPSPLSVHSAYPCLSASSPSSSPFSFSSTSSSSSSSASFPFSLSSAVSDEDGGLRRSARPRHSVARLLPSKRRLLTQPTQPSQRRGPLTGLPPQAQARGAGPGRPVGTKERAAAQSGKKRVERSREKLLLWPSMGGGWRVSEGEVAELREVQVPVSAAACGDVQALFDGVRFEEVEAELAALSEEVRRVEEAAVRQGEVDAPHLHGEEEVEEEEEEEEAERAVHCELLTWPTLSRTSAPTCLSEEG